MQANTNRAAWGAAPQQQHQPHPPATRSRELHPNTGKGARAGAGPLRRATRPAAGLARPPPPPTPDISVLNGDHVFSFLFL